jgi:hypothetical protein
MSQAPADPSALLGRIEALEKRLQELEFRFELENPTIPWTVITAAVAAVLPTAAIMGIEQIAETQPQVLIQNLWSVGGRLDLFSSHRVR